MTPEDMASVLAEEFGADHVELTNTDASFEKQIYIRAGKKQQTNRQPATFVIELRKRGEQWHIQHAAIALPLYLALKKIDANYDTERMRCDSARP